MAKVVGARKRLTTGVVAATLTPMQDDGAPDGELLIAHCKQLLESGCSSIVLLGTTGEANSFTIAERQAILESVVRGGVGPNELIVGTGCCATGDTVALTRHALALGVSRVLMLPPFYYKGVTDEGLFNAYASTIESVNDERLHIYLYSIPQMTGVELSTRLIEKMHESYPSQIAGIKDSSGNWSATEQLCRTLGDKIDVLVGSEAGLVRAVRAGASGCVTATANAAAKPIVELFATRGGASPPTALERNVNATREAFEAFPLIPALKACLAWSTGIASWRNVRPPLRPLARDEADELLRRLQRE